MQELFELARFLNTGPSRNQYEKQLDRLKHKNYQVDSIELAVRGALQNLRSNQSRSFVIYGEPQSGKTEMMICLTAKLLDEGYSFILHLLTDSVDLLEQNLGRFKASGVAPAAKNFTEILDPLIKIEGNKFVIFCKKNRNDLMKLIDKIAEVQNIVIVDDEADYASPNPKINKGEKTKINELIETILGETGIYLGVTGPPCL
jgi:type I site-specific restriction-modification system R (restriction) subunit